MKDITATLLTRTLSLPVMALDLNGNADFTSSYDSKKGKVLFPHGLHAEKLSDQCNFCHSAYRTFGGVCRMDGTRSAATATSSAAARLRATPVST